MSFGFLEFDKMATKFKMAAGTYISLILLSNLQFSTDFKKLYRKNFFSKIQNGGFFEDDVIFEKKLTFFKRVVPTLNSTFLKSEKSKSVVQRPKIYQKNLPKQIFQDGGYFQNDVCSFFFY
jgi:hypothetical protein